ncbi:hypothetical protein JTE90_010954 [Oedothorax gibbosus]|uniref:Thyroglobulin type-1 domain-containing protein n=1 Tax=Oedothorax gibbosus TaxID=931172 RepID=A0AAV6U9G3_9ARAC|nr:hypothetical protein JTE90_010954 [Oedothorax gibbosus]
MTLLSVLCVQDHLDKRFFKRIVDFKTSVTMIKAFTLLVVGVLVSVCVADTELTECQQHRDRESRSNAPLPMRLIPECDDNGDYKPLQCFQNSEFCACWDKAGNPLTQPSKKVKHCECLAKKIDAEANPMPGKFKPRCEDDGKYQKHQCHGSTGFCWCAHPETGEQTSAPARGPQNCD